MEENSWIQLTFGILNALGSLATFLAFIFLFKKDKDKQKQIDKLTSIATVLEGQTDVMIKQNDLLSQQVDIFRNTSILKNQDNQAVQELKEIEIKKLKLSVMPNLWHNGATTRGYEGELNIDINNKGETAYFKEIVLHEGDIFLHNNKTPFEIDKGERRYIFGRTNGKKNINECKYLIELKYHDKLKNEFSTIISGHGANIDSFKTREL